MSDVHRLLVASDLSTAAETALGRGVQLARQFAACLEVLHVIAGPTDDQPFPEELLATLSETARTEAAAGLRRQLARVDPAGPPVEIGRHVSFGKDFVEIIRRAREIAADLIVVGAHGAGGLWQQMLGTTAEKLVRKGDLPVLVVKQPAEGPYRRVLVPVDFSTAADRALATAGRFAPVARLEVLHAYDVWGEAHLAMGDERDRLLERYHQQVRETVEKDIGSLLARAGCSDRVAGRHIECGRPASLIVQVARELDVDLIVMGTRGRSGLPYVLLGSVAERVMRESACDVLLTRPADFRFELV